MHELSIAQSILETVISEKETHAYKKVNSIGLKIGELAGILPDSLEFSFDIIKKDTPLNDTCLEIEEVPLHAKCNSCNHSFYIQNHVFLCPDCNSLDVLLNKGQELEITYLDIE